MAKIPVELSHPLLIALDDVRDKVQALLAVTAEPLTLDLWTRQRLLEAMAMLDDMRTKLAAHADLDALARATPSRPLSPPR